MGDHFLEVDYYQLCKHGQAMCGDAFSSRKGEERVITVLADGLGSGVKAGVLATLTTTMAARFMVSEMDIRRAAEVILETLPVCSKRRIGYSTFTIVDAHLDGKVRIVEYDNPSFVLLRNGLVQPMAKMEVPFETDRRGRLYFTTLTLMPGDRIVFFSDGVCQSGMGRPIMPLGWTEVGVHRFLEEIARENPQISAGEISKRTAQKACEHDGGHPADDITCAALYLRKPRKTLVMTGPPYNSDNDKHLADIARNFSGRKVICGGTTSKILARELNLEMTVNLNELKRPGNVPPSATMPGFDLITEGTITLSKALGILQDDPPLETLPDSPAKRLVNLLLDSDIVQFIVGTRINEAHQDPTLPRELEIRRNLMKQFAAALEKNYMKETSLEFI